MGKYTDKINKMVWSFSRVNSFETCPYSFYLNYLEKNKVKQIQNAFAEYGSFMHELIEYVLGGQMTKKEAVESYKESFDKEVPTAFPFNLRNKYYMEGVSYLKNMRYFEHFEIIEAERAFTVEVADGIKFKGFIDLIMKDKKGNLIILDHKSKASFKPGEIDKYYRQMYLYAIEVMQTFKAKPTKLVFNLFRTNQWEHCDFDDTKYEEARSWLVDSISAIKSCADWKRNYQKGFCEEICSFREHCKEEKFK